MTDVDPTTSRSWLESLDPKVVIAGVAIALCLGIWVGFTVAGGNVAEVAQRCEDCEQRAREADILDVPD
jgi:hypothetical protein